MKKFFLFMGIFMGVIVVVQVGAMEWWKLWMYQGWGGPPPWLWLFDFVKADGERAYDLIEFEMFLIVLMVFFIIFLIILIVFLIVRLIIIMIMFVIGLVRGKTTPNKKPLFPSCAILDQTVPDQNTTRIHQTKFDKVYRFFLVMLILFLALCLDTLIFLGYLLWHEKLLLAVGYSIMTIWQGNWE